MSGSDTTVNYAKYSPITGEIVDAGYCTQDILDANPTLSGFPYVVGKASSDKNYVRLSDLTIQEKLPSPVTVNASTIVADGVSELIFSNVTPNTRFRLIGPQMIDERTSDTTIHLTFDVPGRHLFWIEAPEFLKKEVWIDAT